MCTWMSVFLITNPGPSCSAYYSRPMDIYIYIYIERDGCLLFLLPTQVLVVPFTAQVLWLEATVGTGVSSISSCCIAVDLITSAGVSGSSTRG